MEINIDEYDEIEENNQKRTNMEENQRSRIKVQIVERWSKRRNESWQPIEQRNKALEEIVRKEIKEQENGVRGLNRKTGLLFKAIA